MKNAFLISAALLLAACSGDEPAPTATEEAPIADTEEAVVEPELAEETLEIVEESASEPEPEEQAIVLAQADTPAQTSEYG